jgi:hypothetical protein
MENYRSNPKCGCGRCRIAGMMWPAILITVGGIFLLTEFTHIGLQWPIILLVIGVVKLLQHTASIDGHVPVQMYVPAPVVTPPPVPQSGNLPSEQHGSENQGVHNG